MNNSLCDKVRKTHRLQTAEDFTYATKYHKTLSSESLHHRYYTGQRMFRMGSLTPADTVNCLTNLCSLVLFSCSEICEDLLASPSMCLLGNLQFVFMETNIVHVALTTLCNAMKTVPVNWKNKNHNTSDQQGGCGPDLDGCMWCS